MLMLRLDKWNKNGWQPIVDDIVLFVFSESSHSKHGNVWKLGKVLSCSDRKVEMLYVSKISKTGSATKSKLFRSVRDVKIIFSVESFLSTQTITMKVFIYCLMISRSAGYGALQQIDDLNNFGCLQYFSLLKGFTMPNYFFNTIIVDFWLQYLRIGCT